MISILSFAGRSTLGGHALGRRLVRQRALIVKLHAAKSAVIKTTARHPLPGIHGCFQHPVNVISLREQAQAIRAAKRTAGVLAEIIRITPRHAYKIFALRTLENAHVEKSLRKCTVDAVKSHPAFPAMGHCIEFFLSQIALTIQLASQ
jgi:hypothetical protein